MMHRVAAACVILGAAACSSGGGYDENMSRPKDVWRASDRPPAQTAGKCNRCNYHVFDGHRCGLTHPCALCGREAGARHVHEVVWMCDEHELPVAERHICDDAKTCRICRHDQRSFLGSRGCGRCFKQVPPQKVRGITRYCQECNQEVGANHIHGKTWFCLKCTREAGENHIHDATRLCMEHETEHSPDHVHGTTTYCHQCHREAGEEHRHGVTEWCWACGVEKDWPHSHHN